MAGDETDEQRRLIGSLSEHLTPSGNQVEGMGPRRAGQQGNTLASIASVGSNDPSSIAQSASSKEAAGDNNVHMRTFDYLGLTKTLRPGQAAIPGGGWIQPRLQRPQQHLIQVRPSAVVPSAASPSR